MKPHAYAEPMSTGAVVLIEREMEAQDDADFAAAALRRAFLRLFAGNVAHTELSVELAAKLLNVPVAMLQPQLDRLIARGRVVRWGDTYALPKAKPALRVAKKGAEPGPLKGPRQFQQTKEWRERLDRLVEVVRERTRIDGAEVAGIFGCSMSTAWSMLVTLEHRGALQSASERSSRGSVCRFYRIAGGEPPRQLSRATPERRDAILRTLAGTDRLCAASAAAVLRLGMSTAGVVLRAMESEGLLVSDLEPNPHGNGPGRRYYRRAPDQGNAS